MPSRKLRRALASRTAILVALTGLAALAGVTVDPPRAAAQDAGSVTPEGADSRLIPGQGPDWMPLQGSVELWCTQSNPGYGGCSGHHDRPALDIGVPTGTPVFAAGPGVVIEATGGGAGRGTYVDLLHPDGSSSHYYHLSATDVVPGQVVDRGDLLGRSGSTGSTSAPHLHYEEHGPDGQNRPIGPMLAQVGENVVTYPQGQYGIDWPSVPYGTVLTNDGYRPVGGDLNGDGRPERATGALSASDPAVGVSTTSTPAGPSL